MKETRKLQEVKFDSLKELKTFLEEHNEAFFYDTYENEWIPIVMNEITKKPSLGYDCWKDVEEEDLETIFGIVK